MQLNIVYQRQKHEEQYAKDETFWKISTKWLEI